MCRMMGGIYLYFNNTRVAATKESVNTLVKKFLDVRME